MRFVKSFKYAFRGIVYCINNERNMRIHAVVTLYVFAFSFFFGLSGTSYAVLFLTFASVWMAELFNTVAEELCDMTASSFHPVVRIVKDMASGSVLVGAVFSLCVAVCLFCKPSGFRSMGSFFLLYPVSMPALAAVTAASLVFIVKGPLGIRDSFRERRSVKKKGDGRRGK